MFAEWKKTERSLYFSTGYQANLSVISAFVEKDDIVFSDQLNHASLIDGIRLAKAKRVVCTHCDIDFVARELRDYRAKGQKFFITESLFSMDGDIAPLDKYAEICRETRTNLIVDEAHAVGIYGETGSGLIEHFGIEKDVFLSINTAGKALGVSGAFVAGAEWAIEYLIQTARPFIFSTAPPPMTAAAIMAAVNIVRTETERCARLSRLVTFFNELLRFNEIAVTDQEVETQIIPIHIGKNRRATEVAGLLQASGFDVRAIRPPTVPDGTARLRISLNALLTEDKLREFVRCLKNALAQD
jgi:8-amino-7-oxononanoate synthase